MPKLPVRVPRAPYYPRSFTILVIVAMGVLIVPLASGLINAIHVLQGVVDTQRDFTRTSLATTRDVRLVVEAVSEFQRASGQYHLLKDPDFAPTLRMRYAALQTHLGALDPVLVDTPVHATLTQLATQAQALYRKIQPGRYLPSERFHRLDPEFDALHGSARRLLGEADAAVQQELKALEATVRATRERLIILALALIPLTLLLAAVFSWMINRPIKQLKASIQQLGRANLAPLPNISGPQDMVELGREVDWLRQRLQALEEQKLRFLRHVSHELKTPLASLREGVGLLSDELAGTLNPRQRSIIDIMDKSSRDLQQRIEDLLRHGSRQAETWHAVATMQSLPAALDAVLARHQLLLTARGIEVERALDEASLRAERSQLETILDNLISNAIRFSPEGGRIFLASERRDNEVVLWFCDQGSGIPEHERTRVFEPFFRGSHQPDCAIKGSGLGLSIVREHLLDAGGRIEVVDRPPWSTCFRLTWPLAS